MLWNYMALPRHCFFLHSCLLLLIFGTEQKKNKENRRQRWLYARDRFAFYLDTFWVKRVLYMLECAVCVVNISMPYYFMTSVRTYVSTHIMDPLKWQAAHIHTLIAPVLFCVRVSVLYFLMPLNMHIWQWNIGEREWCIHSSLFSHWLCKHILPYWSWWVWPILFSVLFHVPRLWIY